MSLILIKDLGMKYPTEKSSRKHRFGLYKCFCGVEFEAITNAVKRKHTKSCGCLNIVHNLTNHRLYNIYNSMIKRCTQENDLRYKYYGARGISVCDRWLNINNFIEDMYPSYIDGLTLDRIDVNGNYCKENCRWTTMLLQARNTRRLRSTNKSGYRGVSKNHNKWATTITVNYKKIRIGVFKCRLEAAYAYDKYVIDGNLEHTLNFKGL